MKRIIGIYMMLCFWGSCYAQQSDSVVFNTTLLVQADSMPVNRGQLIALPQQGLFIVDGSTFYSLDKERCPDINKFRLLESFPFDQVIVNDNEFVVKCQQFLMQLEEKETEILAEFDTEYFTVFPGNDSIINVVVYDETDSCGWYKLDRRTGATECILRQAEPIKKIVAGNQIDFCIIGNNIFYVKDDICDEVVISEMPIIDMILLPQGLMFCTDDQLSIFDNESVIPLLEGDFHGLHNDEDFVYVVLKNGNIWRMTDKRR